MRGHQRAMAGNERWSWSQSLLKCVEGEQAMGVRDGWTWPPATDVEQAQSARASSHRRQGRWLQWWRRPNVRHCFSQLRAQRFVLFTRFLVLHAQQPVLPWHSAVPSGGSVAESQPAGNYVMHRYRWLLGCDGGDSDAEADSDTGSTHLPARRSRCTAPQLSLEPAMAAC